jgi:hypothetical protein
MPSVSTSSMRSIDGVLVGFIVTVISGLALGAAGVL